MFPDVALYNGMCCLEYVCVWFFLFEFRFNYTTSMPTPDSTPTFPISENYGNMPDDLVIFHLAQPLPYQHYSIVYLKIAVSHALRYMVRS